MSSYFSFYFILLQIVTLDARNHGESEHSPEMNYFVQALDVCCLFQELELSKAVVMGHSMGGKTAMTLALSYPEYVQSLIVVDMSPTKVTLDDDIPQYLAAKRDMNLAFVNNKRDAERMLMNAVPVRKVSVFSKLLALFLKLSSIICYWH